MNFEENLNGVKARINGNHIHLEVLSGVVDGLNKGLSYTNSLLVKDMAKYPGLFDVSVGQIDKNIPPGLRISPDGKLAVVLTYQPGEAFSMLYSPGYSDSHGLSGILYASESPVCESHPVSVTQYSEYVCGKDEILNKIAELNTRKTDITDLLEKAGLLKKPRTGA